MPAKLSACSLSRFPGDLNTDRAMVLPAFPCMLVRCSGGPITGYCGERFGLYAVTLTGCVLSALGVGACFLAEDIITVIIFLGLVYGLGMNFSTTLFPQVLKQHFNKNLTFVISMSMFGSCFGGFVIPPLIKWIFQSYGVSGTFLIMAGIMLNGVPAAMYLKILKPKKTSTQISKKEVTLLVAAPVELVDANKIKNIDDEKQKNIEGKKEHCIWELRDTSNNKIPNSLSSEPIDDEKLINNGTTINFKPHLIEDKLLKNNKDTLEQTATLLPKFIESVHENTENNVTSEAKVANKKPVSKQKAALQSLTIFFDFAFLTMLVSQSAEVVIQILTLTTVLDYARDKGIDRSYEVYFLMALALAELFGRVFISLIIDRNYLTKNNFTILSFIILAVVVLIMVWAKTFAVMMVGILAFGLVTSGLLSVFPMLIFEFIEPKNYIMALASYAFLYGPMSLLCSPLVGYFRGTRGSYDWVYYIQAITSVVCAILAMTTPYFAKRRDRKKAKRKEKAKLKSTINA
ncbi:Monocarboxylate transporter 9 like protein [Argiope bruennichi]|uniref:Monocarboxylate transporter 9 like protein n=2 Tax=Argiope bruennichi TaxID=94029 RepID=A0A8T0EBM8_ARGBR|nr:Monocarboxylate transporter 9 like protein [Argiope bruennichi]